MPRPKKILNPLSMTDSGDDNDDNEHSDTHENADASDGETVDIKTKKKDNNDSDSDDTNDSDKNNDSFKKYRPVWKSVYARLYAEEQRFHNVSSSQGFAAPMLGSSMILVEPIDSSLVNLGLENKSLEDFAMMYCIDKHNKRKTNMHNKITIESS